MANEKNLLESKKFWAAVVALVVIVANEFGAGLDEATVLNTVLVIVGYITGQGLADLGKNGQ